LLAEETLSTPRTYLLAGVRDATPILLGILPFSMITGVAAVSVGVPKMHALALSVFVFAGASQLAALELIDQHAPALIVILTALVINLRFVMYSASIAPHFQRLPGRWKRPLAYLLTDQAYALSISRFKKNPQTSRGWYYLGAAGTLWVTWQTGTTAGILLGAQIPASWSLDFAIPLTFLAILVPLLDERAVKAAALTAAVVAVAAKTLPFNLALPLAALTGIGIGLIVEKRAA
jgi:4-azaleucine resistance transporter AzlC